MSTHRTVMQSPVLNERAVRIALESLTLRSHRLWLSEPADQRQSLPLCEELFDVQIQIQRLELKLQAGIFREQHLSLLTTITDRVGQLETDWENANSTDDRTEPIPWT